MRQISPLTRSLLAPNAGPMTLDGTNSYLIGGPGAGSVVVVDPGPFDEPHLAQLATAARVELVLITHFHGDYTAGSARLAALTGAPVRAFVPAFCISGNPLVDGELIEGAGRSIRVVATPGHTADSVCFHLPDDGQSGSVLTGDRILGRGTTMIDISLGDYLHSLAARPRRRYGIAGARPRAARPCCDLRGLPGAPPSASRPGACGTGRARAGRHRGPGHRPGLCRNGCRRALRRRGIRSRSTGLPAHLDLTGPTPAANRARPRSACCLTSGRHVREEGFRRQTEGPARLKARSKLGCADGPNRSAGRNA